MKSLGGCEHIVSHDSHKWVAAMTDKTNDLLTKYTVSNVSHLWGQQQKDIDQLFLSDSRTLLAIACHC
jgi:hypothetical protein